MYKNIISLKNCVIQQFKPSLSSMVTVSTRISPYFRFENGVLKLKKISNFSDDSYTVSSIIPTFTQREFSLDWNITLVEVVEKSLLAGKKKVKNHLVIL